MKLEVGIYAKTKRKGIIKINEVIDNGVITYEDDLGREWEEETGRKVIRYIGKDGWNCGIDENEILKASHNIIDLIEVGDYVNGHLVLDVFWNVEGDYVVLIEDAMYDLTRILYNNDIKSIVTKEMYSSVEYRVAN